ncbi:MAG: hypothetical protein U0103_11700 [Candidatus Obscuribacterales bacterium]
MTIPLLFSVLIGISGACVAVPTQAALQAAVPEDLRGKVRRSKHGNVGCIDYPCDTHWRVRR